MIAIIDYGSGNLASVKNALDRLGFDSIITDKQEAIESAEKIIFPGQGSFGDAVKCLKEKQLFEFLKKQIPQKPFLGICIGMQLLFESSDESPGVKGLSVFKGTCKKFIKGKIPQIGWNTVSNRDSFFYFVNSYYVKPVDLDIIFATTDYYKVFPSIIKEDNITAVQFHPEKSGIPGLEFLERWCTC